MRLPKLLIVVLVAVLLCGSLQAAKRKSTPIDPAVKAKIDALQKELSQADAQMYAAFRKLEKNDAIVALRKAALDADRAYQNAKETDVSIVEAKSVYRKASAQHKALVLEKIKASPAGAALLKEKIDVLRRDMAKSDDPELKAARAKVKTAHDGYEKAYYGGTMKALRDKRDAAKAAIRAGIKELIANDPALSALSARIDKLNVEIRKLGGRPRRSSKRS